MWSAIKSDLFEFVTTVKADTSKVVTKVLGEESSQDNEVNETEKRIADLTRSFHTFSTPIDSKDKKSFDAWYKGFSLTGKGSEIAQVLDQEHDVSRYYADLVPLKISAEEFWARYFFRLAILQKGGVLSIEEEDEEDIGWEDEDAVTTPPIETNTTTILSINKTDNILEDESTKQSNNTELTRLNDILHIEISNLKSRITTLEYQLHDKETALSLANKKISELELLIGNNKEVESHTVMKGVSQPEVSSEILGDGNTLATIKNSTKTSLPGEDSPSIPAVATVETPKNLSTESQSIASVPTEVSSEMATTVVSSPNTLSTESPKLVPKKTKPATGGLKTTKTKPSLATKVKDPVVLKSESTEDVIKAASTKEGTAPLASSTPSPAPSSPPLSTTDASPRLRRRGDVIGSREAGAVKLGDEEEEDEEEGGWETSWA